jgi:DNA-binding NtrC family response regulator
MSTQTIAVPRKKVTPELCVSQPKKHVIVFSPDADLARVLLLNLEDRFQIVRVHKLEDFEQAINKNSPDLVLVDLFTFSEGIAKQFEVMHKMSNGIPVIALRAYMSLTSELNKSIDNLADKVFYKPVDVELVTQAIEDLLK